MKQFARKLSIVVIGKNQGRFLPECFRSIQAMQWSGEREIIYVDTASNDDSLRIARSFGIDSISINPPNPSAAIARNVGWKAARHPFILFLDGDTVLHPSFAERALPLFSDPQIGIVCGHRREKNPYATVYQSILDVDWAYPTGMVEWCGGDAMIRREVLQLTKGYKGSLVAGEDAELSFQIRAQGYKIVRLDIPMTQHDLDMRTFAQYWKRSFRTGYAYAGVAAATNGKLWHTESIYNLCKGGFLLAAAFACLAAAYWTLWPAIALSVLLLAAAVRTAVLMRQKFPSWSLCLRYGWHAHLQHIPMFFGQLAFWLNPKHRLIEYQSP